MAVYDVYEEIARLLEHDEIVTAMEADHLFWQLQLGALQHTLFVILGRVFDKRSDTHSAAKVLDAALNHIEIFSHEALARRKTQGRSDRPAWLDGYIAQAWVAEQKSFVNLQFALASHEAVFRKIYQPLRHQYFAHRAIDPAKSFADMFQQTNREELGTTVKFLRDLAEALFQTFVNGKPPIIGNATYESDRSELRCAVSSVLRKLMVAPLSGT